MMDKNNNNGTGVCNFLIINHYCNVSWTRVCKLSKIKKNNLVDHPPLRKLKGKKLNK